MQIQINSDKNIAITSENENTYQTKTENGLQRFESLITRVEVHLSDENAQKSGTDDKKCLIEVRMENRQPISVTATSDVIEKAFADALNKMKRKMGTIHGKLTDR
jgi:hypothetical protein